MGIEVELVMAQEQQLASVLKAVIELPAQWHGAGTFNREALKKLLEHASGLDIHHSVETGTGKTTLLFSHLSAHHTVFAKDDSGDGDSLHVVRESPILRKEGVEFVVGPTQRTLPRHDFRDKLQLVLIDGPHGYPFPDLEYYYLYPQVGEGGLLILDDINIPTVFNLFSFLREDRMFELIEVVETTAFFRRTEDQLLDPFGDGWWLQQYNQKRFPIQDRDVKYSMSSRLKYLVPEPLKAFVKKAVRSVRADK
jgi:methyltransferase family protein